MSKFLYAENTNNDVKAITIPRVLSKNSQAKNDTFYLLTSKMLIHLDAETNSF